MLIVRPCWSTVESMCMSARGYVLGGEKYNSNCLHVEPSNYISHGGGISMKNTSLLGRSSFSFQSTGIRRPARKSTSACPLAAFYGTLTRSYYSKITTHFANHPLRTGLNKTYLISLTLVITHTM